MSDLPEFKLVSGAATFRVTNFSQPPGRQPKGTHPEVAAVTAENAPSEAGKAGKRCFFTCVQPLKVGDQFALIGGGLGQTIRIVAESGTAYTAEFL